MPPLNSRLGYERHGCRCCGLPIALDVQIISLFVSGRKHKFDIQLICFSFETMAATLFYSWHYACMHFCFALVCFDELPWGPPVYVQALTNQFPRGFCTCKGLPSK